MATFVAPLESQATSERVSAEARTAASPSSLVSGLTLFALAVHGYHPYAEDGGLYLAGVKRLLDPALYPHQTAFVLEPTRFSLFAPAVAGPRPPQPSALALAASCACISPASGPRSLPPGCSHPAAGRSRTARAGAVVLLACWLTLPVAGTALLLMDPYVTARSLSTPCMILALLGALDFTEPGRTQTRRRGLWLCIGSTTLAAAMHPLMAAYSLARNADARSASASNANAHALVHHSARRRRAGHSPPAYNSSPARRTRTSPASPSPAPTGSPPYGAGTSWWAWPRLSPS